MQIYAINASPRKKANTATLLQAALTSAQKNGATTELFNLYDYTYTGCKSCFACKLIGGQSYGHCALKDELTPILEKVSQADAIILGSPIYFGGVTGMLRSFEERLLFPFLTYTETHESIAPKKLRTAFIYTMNAPKPMVEQLKYPERLNMMEGYVGHIFGSQPLVLYAYNTVQFNDYSKYLCTMFSAEEKAKYKAEHFPEDLRKAEEIGASLAKA